MDSLESNASPAEQWACVEIFGHRKHYGRISEIEQFGAKMLRVEVPLPVGQKNAAGEFVAEGATEEGFAVLTYGGAAIFSVTLLTEDSARKWAAHERRYGREPLSLAPPREAFLASSPELERAYDCSAYED